MLPICFVVRSMGKHGQGRGTGDRGDGVYQVLCSQILSQLIESLVVQKIILPCKEMGLFV